MTEQVPATKNSDTPIVVEETIEVPVAENDTESITPERLEKATEIIEETAELGEFEADIREESVAAIDKEHEEEEIATLLEEEKLLKRRFFIL
jgi:tellurite resistance protein